MGVQLKLAGTFLGWWAALVVLWLLLVDAIQTQELVVGSIAAAVSATVATAVLRRGYIRFWPRALWVLEVPNLIASVIIDCVVLAGALWRRVVRREPVRGLTVRVPFRHGGDNARDGARRALANFAVSLTPNSYVVDMDPEGGDSLLVHRLVPAPPDRVLQRGEPSRGDGS